MSNIENEILITNQIICKNIDKFDASERGLLSQNIIAQLRNFVEQISLRVWGGRDVENNYDNISQANRHIKTQGRLKFLSKFHKLLQTSASHYNQDEESSERLMLKYYS